MRKNIYLCSRTQKYVRDMKIILERYFGNNQVTKSHLLMVHETGEIAFEGEARESTFRDYREKFHGCMSCCVAEGENFRVDIGGSNFSPMTFKLVKIPGRLSCCFIGDAFNEGVYQHINVGYADKDADPIVRRLRDVEKAKQRMLRLAYEVYTRDEEITCDVTNHLMREQPLRAII